MKYTGLGRLDELPKEKRGDSSPVPQAQPNRPRQESGSQPEIRWVLIVFGVMLVLYGLLSFLIRRWWG